MRSLQKNALDNLVDQLVAKLGDVRIVAPNAPLAVSDERYLGTLKGLLLAAFPGTPPAAFSGLRDDLIVLARTRETRSDLAHFARSTLRVPNKVPQDALQRWRDAYGDLLSVDIFPTRHLEADLRNCSLVFREQFFAERSLESWAALTLKLARACAAFVELKSLSRLQAKEISRVGTDSHLVPARLERMRHGRAEELELAPR